MQQAHRGCAAKARQAATLQWAGQQRLHTHTATNIHSAPPPSLLDCAVVHAPSQEQNLARRRRLAGIHVADEHNVQVLPAGRQQRQPPQQQHVT